MYNYETEKPWLFTDEGQRVFLKIRDQVFSLLRTAGAVDMQHAIAGVSAPDNWTLLACVDRLVELEEIREINYGDCPAQYRIFVLRNGR